MTISTVWARFEKKMTIWCFGEKKNDNIKGVGKKKDLPKVIFFSPNSDIENVFHKKSRNIVIFFFPKSQLEGFITKRNLLAKFDKATYF